MSKKNFIQLADVIRHFNSIAAYGFTPAFTTEQISALADFCRAQNSAFMRDRWLDYVNGIAGPSGGTIKGSK